MPPCQVTVGIGCAYAFCACILSAARLPLRKVIALRDNVHVAINPAREPQTLSGTDLDGHGLGLRNGEDGRVVHDLRHRRRRRRHIFAFAS